MHNAYRRPTRTLEIQRRPRLMMAVLCGAMFISLIALVSAANADAALCASGHRCRSTAVDSTSTVRQRMQDLTSALQLSTAAGTGTTLGRTELSDQEATRFSGIGAVVCSIDDKQVMSTAFLVGAFDIGVTVAHTFEDNGHWATPEDCVYTSTDSLGQIRERIPIQQIKAQWQAEEGAFGQPAKDFAVIRLSHPSHYAQRTMPLGKFSGSAAPVVMVGFNSDIYVDATKSKRRGTVYERKVNGVAISNLAGFMHDMDSRGIAAGAPVIDERTGVTIGIHTTWKPPATTAASRSLATRNAMISMNQWLESTLRTALQAVAKAEE